MDPAVPEHRRQWNIPDRAYERDHRHQGPDDRSPELGNERVVDNEERLPEFRRHPGSERTGNEQAAGDVEPDRGPVHHEIMADRGKTLFGRYPLPKRAASADRHI